MRGLLYILVIIFAITTCGAFEGNAIKSVSDHERPTDHWAVEVHPGVNPDLLAKEHGFINMGPVGTLQDIYLFSKATRTARMVIPNQKPIHESPHVKWAENQVAKLRFRRESPINASDPLFPNQWHLKNSNGVDINVLGAWNNGISGQGVTIAMVDDGLQKEHPDIQPNYVPEGSFDFNDNDAFPDPHIGDDHGTSAGGVAAAKNNNNCCGSGAAPNARLSGIRLIADYTTDAQEAAGLTFRTDINDIYSNSWGPNDDGRRLEKPGSLTQRAMDTAIRTGRGGKGSVYVWAGGNGRSSGDNCNYDGYANSRFAIAIGATDYMGKQSYYSENCAALIACAPSSGSGRAITTTDLTGSAGSNPTDCTSGFGGTSAAAPLVAGVVALVLEANPELGWRDVQHIFVTTSRVTDSTDSDWFTNGGGYHHNHKYGFGLVDAGAATEAAKTHVNLPAVRVHTSAVTNTNKGIADRTPLVSSINVNERFVVERVEVVFKAKHQCRGDLLITLTSPFGTKSVLQEPHSDRSSDIDWTYTTVRSWGESSSGQWTLDVEDKVSGNTGTWNSWQLVIYGH